MTIVQKNIAMIIMLVISFLDKFINKMIRLSFQMAHISFFLDEASQKNSAHGYVEAIDVSIEHFSIHETCTHLNSYTISAPYARIIEIYKN